MNFEALPTTPIFNLTMCRLEIVAIVSDKIIISNRHIPISLIGFFHLYSKEPLQIWTYFLFVDKFNEILWPYVKQVKVLSCNYSAGCERSEFYIFYEFAMPQNSGGQ